MIVIVLSDTHMLRAAKVLPVVVLRDANAGALVHPALQRPHLPVGDLDLDQHEGVAAGHGQRLGEGRDGFIRARKARGLEIAGAVVAKPPLAAAGGKSGGGSKSQRAEQYLWRRRREH